MLDSPRSWVSRPEIDARALILLTSVISLLLLVVSIYYLTAFREQRQEARANDARLDEWNTQLLTATPAAIERERLAVQLDLVRQEFAAASGLLPGTDVEVQIQERVLEAAALSNVSVTALSKVGDSFQEGSLVGWRYDLGAKGELARLTEFVSRLEEEAFPAAFLEEPLVNEGADGSYNLSSLLTIYGSTLSTADLIADETLSPEQLVARLREQAATALSTGDYELALSSLLQVAALQPDDPSIDQQLYDVYVAYAESLLQAGYPELAEEQAEAALALNPDGQEAVSILVTIAQQGSGTPGGGTPNASPPVIAIGSPTAGPGSTPRVTATRPGGSSVPPTVPAPATRGATRTPFSTATRYIPPTVRPPATRISTRTPLATRTSRPGSTVVPTRTATPHVSATPGGNATATGSAVAGATNTATSVPSSYPYPYGAQTTIFQPNCDVTLVKGFIWSDNGVAINGVTVRVWWDGAPPDGTYSLPSGASTTNGPGYWDVLLNDDPTAGKWYINVVDPNTGEALSEVVTAYTDTGPCEPGQSGHQVVWQDFVKMGVTLPTGVPTSAPTATRTPTVTTTPTQTLTPTPSPTLTPVTYTIDEEPDLIIPDGPDGVAESEVDIPDTLVLRDARVFLNIEHEQAGDLQVDLIHPDGSVVRLVDYDEYLNQTMIRRWIEIDGSDLTPIANKPINGTWTLRIIDDVELYTGTLLSWKLEIYP